MDILQNAVYWHWLLLGVVLIVLEMFAPGVLFLWMGLAAGVVGLVLLLVPELSWEAQWLLFGALSIVSVIAARALLKRDQAQTDQPTLNRRGEQYVGRTFTLSEPIVNGNGKIRVDDSTWKVHGDDCAAGTQVRVSGVDGAVLRVELISLG